MGGGKVLLMLREVGEKVVGVRVVGVLRQQRHQRCCSHCKCRLKQQYSIIRCCVRALHPCSSAASPHTPSCLLCQSHHCVHSLCCMKQPPCILCAQQHSEHAQGCSEGEGRRREECGVRRQL